MNPYKVINKQTEAIIRKDKKTAMFVGQSFKINVVVTKIIIKLEIIPISEYRDAAHNICNLKYSIRIKMIITFCMDQIAIITLL